MSAERWTKALQSGAETPEGLRRRLAQAKLALDDARFFKQDDAELAGEVADLESVLAQADAIFAGSYGKDFRTASAGPGPRVTPKADATRDRLVKLDRQITDLEYDLQDARRLRRTEDEILKIRRDLSNAKSERDDMKRGLKANPRARAAKKNPPTDTRGRDVWRTYEADPTPLNLLAVERERVRGAAPLLVGEPVREHSDITSVWELYRGTVRMAAVADRPGTRTAPSPIDRREAQVTAAEAMNQAQVGDQVVTVAIWSKGRRGKRLYVGGMRRVHAVLCSPKFTEIVQKSLTREINGHFGVSDATAAAGLGITEDSEEWEEGIDFFLSLLEESLADPQTLDVLGRQEDQFWPNVMREAETAGVVPQDIMAAVKVSAVGVFWDWHNPLLTWEPETLKAWGPGGVRRGRINPPESDLRSNPKLSVSKGKLKLGKTPIKEAPELHGNLAVIGPLGEPGAFFGYDPSTRVMLFLTDDRFRPEVAAKAQKGEFPIFQRRRMIGGSGTIEAFWRHQDAKNVAAAAQFYYDGAKVVVTHLAVRPKFQRMGLGERLLKWIQASNPGRTVVGTDYTNAGRAFSQKHGVEELK